MATDRTGALTTNVGIQKYNPDADAPSGLGFNGAMDDIDVLLQARITKALLTTAGDIIYASGVSTPARLPIGSTGNVLTVAGGVPVWSPSSSATNYRKTTAKAVNTTVAATDLLNGEITVGAGVMGATGVLRIKAWGDYLNNTGGALAQPRLQLVLGGTTVFDTGVTASAIGASASRFPWKIEATIMNLTASSQSAEMFVPLHLFPSSGVTNTWTTGEGYWNEGVAGTDTIGFGLGINSGLAINTALASALVLNVINGSASASYETKLLGALIEVV